MLQQFYSTSDASLLLHTIADANYAGTNRLDVTPADKLLQASIIPLAQGFQVKPHAHDLRSQSEAIQGNTQECWFVYKGRLLVQLFDEHKKFLHEQELNEGQFLITFSGAHSLKCLSDNTILLEFKNGPYMGKDYQSFTYEGHP